MFSMILIWIHILAAMFWIGGMLFFSLVLVPSLRGLPASQRADLMSQIGQRYRRAGWISLAVLLVTGLLRLYQLGFAPLATDGWIWTKLALVLVMIGLTLLHDLLLGPRSIQISRSTAAPHPLQQNVRWMARLNLVIGLFVVLAAVYVARGY
jgi:uncharacterized membrane protein